MTIYEKESQFESVEDQFCALKTYIEASIGEEEIHIIEGEVFRQLQRIGLGLLESFVALSGTGYEAGIPLLSEDGRPMKYKGIKPEASPYLSIFGELRIYRASYAHPDGGRVYPIDAQLNLPEHKYSYLLLKWLQASSADQDFRSAVERFNEIFDLSLSAEVPQRQGLPIGASVEPFYEQVEAPRAETEGSHIAMSADCKGVRILKSEREEATEAVPAKPRRDKGEKPGIKKDAVVVTDFSFDPEARDAQEIVKGLLNQFTEKEKAEAKKDRQDRREEGIGAPRAPRNKHVFATLDGKKAAFEHLLDQVQKRDPEGQKLLIALLDGELALEDRLLEELETRNLMHRLDAVILDIIHASEYLWDVGTALYGEKGAKQWVEAKLHALLSGKVNTLIGGLRQMRTKKQDQLTKRQKKALESLRKVSCP